MPKGRALGRIKEVVIRALGLSLSLVRLKWWDGEWGEWTLGVANGLSSASSNLGLSMDSIELPWGLFIKKETLPEGDGYYIEDAYSKVFDLL